MTAGGLMMSASGRGLALAVCALAVMGAVLTLGHGAAAAYPWYPYCGVYQDRSGSWTCRFASLEECTYTMRAGNSGFCRENPAPRPGPPVRRRAPRR